jgi:RING finger/CCCH-type zinc finger protein
MAPLGQGLIWSEVLCCPLCSQIFSSVRVPVNLLCGHAACLSCLHNKPTTCPSDSVRIPDDICDYPINTSILLILNVPLDAFIDNSLSAKNRNSSHYEYICDTESSLHSLARYLRVADSERGGSVYSDLVSRTIQRKIITILCSALTQSDGRIQAMRSIRSLSERIVTELICVVQNTVHLSAFLWSAVRARGCQFLGPAMQEDVLKLILLTLVNGELIARKTLVMYIVQTLLEDYPHVSKTCVGHVVQLLYRASCFNVIIFIYFKKER